MNMEAKPNRRRYHVRGHYRLLSFSLAGRPVFVVHGLYKRLLENAGGRLPLAGNPVPLDLGFEVEIHDAAPLWKGKAVARVSDLDGVPIKSLAPGVVAVTGAYSTFLFYGGAWFQLAQTHLVAEESDNAGQGDNAETEADGQRRFLAAIDRHDRVTGVAQEREGEPRRPTIHKKPRRFPQ